MNPNRPISPSARMSIPAVACFRTASSTALLTRPAKPVASNGWPCSFAWIISNRSGGRGRLPTWVVNIRSVRRFISLLRRVRQPSAKGSSGQYRAQCGDRRHEEIGGSRQHDELLRHFERRPPVPYRIVRKRLVHLADAIAGRLADDRVKPRHDRDTVVGAALAVDELGVVGIPALDELELALDRGLIADEHQAAAVHCPNLARHDFRAERNPGADDPVPQGFRLAAGRIVARVGLADVRSVGTRALKRVVRVVEIVVAHIVGGERGIVAQRRQLQRCAAPPSPDHARGQKLGINTEPRGLSRDETPELRHALLQPPKHHVGAVAGPGRREWRDRARLFRVLRILARIAKYEFAGPDQVLPGKALIGGGAGARWPGHPADARLRDAVHEAEMLTAA